MKEIIKFFVNLFGRKSFPINEQKRYKRMIRVFFDGDVEGKKVHQEPKGTCHLCVLGITDVKFKDTDLTLIITITLDKPGLLIGKKGDQVRRLVDYLSIDKKVEIKTIESKLWR